MGSETKTTFCGILSTFLSNALSELYGVNDLLMTCTALSKKFPQVLNGWTTVWLTLTLKDKDDVILKMIFCSKRCLLFPDRYGELFFGDKWYPPKKTSRRSYPSDPLEQHKYRCIVLNIIDDTTHVDDRQCLSDRNVNHQRRVHHDVVAVTGENVGACWSGKANVMTNWT